MCRRVDGSGSIRIVLYTVDKPYSTARPGFLIMSDPDSPTIQFSDDIWNARTWMNRNDLGAMHEWLQSQAKKHRLLTHEATAAMTVPR